jgi:hypothetical protein
MGLDQYAGFRDEEGNVKRNSIGVSMLDYSSLWQKNLTNKTKNKNITR